MEMLTNTLRALFINNCFKKICYPNPININNLDDFIEACA